MQHRFCSTIIPFLPLQSILFGKVKVCWEYHLSTQTSLFHSISNCDQKMRTSLHANLCFQICYEIGEVVIWGIFVACYAPLVLRHKWSGLSGAEPNVSSFCSAPNPYCCVSSVVLLFSLTHPPLKRQSSGLTGTLTRTHTQGWTFSFFLSSTTALFVVFLFLLCYRRLDRGVLAHLDSPQEWA